MSELAFFPEPFPEEDFRSWMYRFHIMAPNKDFIQTNEEMFGINSHRNSHIPKNLRAFLNRLPEGHGYSIDSILDNHTLWPLIKPFLSNEDLELCMDEIEYEVRDSTNFVMHQLTAPHSRVLSSDIRYCPKCLVEDYETYGTCYVHRTHQIKPIDICHVHYTALITHCPECNVQLPNNTYKDGLLLRPQCQYGHQIHEESQPILALDNKLEFCKDIETLLKCFRKIDRAELLCRFEIALASKGYMYLISGKVKRSKLLEDIQSQLSASRPHGMSLMVQNPGSIRGFRTVLNNGWCIRDLTLCVFLMKFLCGDVESFFHNSLSIALPIPFGVGPWFCKNRICPDFDRPVIQTAGRTIVQSNTVSGNFICPTCGCTYIMKWRSETPDSYFKHKITEMGFLWNDMALRLFNQGHRFVEIAEKMHTSRTHVVGRLKRLEPSIGQRTDYDHNILRELKAIHSEVAVTLQKSNRTNEHREEILEILKTHDGIKRKDINHLARGALSWLMKHDRDWIDRILPPCRGGIHLDWASIDEELVEKIKTVANNVYAINPPHRISKNMIAQLLTNNDRLHLMMGPARVPNAWSVLCGYEECKDDFLVRNTPRLVEQLLNKGFRNVTLHSILSNRESYRGCSEEVRHRIVKILEDMGFENVEYGMSDYTQ